MWIGNEKKQTCKFYLVHKGKESHSLPGILLSIQINFEILRIEIDDRAFGVNHQVSPRDGYVGPGGSGEDAHELLQGVEGLRVLLKVHADIRDTHKVGCEGCVVVREIPFP